MRNSTFGTVGTDAQSERCIAFNSWKRFLPERARFSPINSGIKPRNSERFDDGCPFSSFIPCPKVNVCPYWGHEIPDWQELGLNPDRMYHLLRSPEELRKGAETLNGVPLLLGHTPATPDDHPSDKVMGSLGTEAKFDGEYLDNSLIVWTREGIDAVESEEAKELSCKFPRQDPRRLEWLDIIEEANQSKPRRLRFSCAHLNVRSGKASRPIGLSPSVMAQRVVLNPKPNSISGFLSDFVSKIGADLMLVFGLWSFRGPIRWSTPTSWFICEVTP